LVFQGENEIFCQKKLKMEHFFVSLISAGGHYHIGKRQKCEFCHV
jgi:hypothetical protein